MPAPYVPRGLFGSTRERASPSRSASLRTHFAQAASGAPRSRALGREADLGLGGLPTRKTLRTPEPRSRRRGYLTLAWGRERAWSDVPSRDHSRGNIALGV